MARILIAEDEEALRALIARALLESGHDVITKPFSLGAIRAALTEALAVNAGRTH